MSAEDQTQDYVHCPRCKAKALLASGSVDMIFPDQEPYANGVIEKTEWDDGISTFIGVNCHWCPECGHLFDASVYDPLPDAPEEGKEEDHE